MKKLTFYLWIALTVIMLFPLCLHARTLPKIRILAMGGTIAGCAASATETKDYRPGTLDIATMIKSIPGLDTVADISGEQVANIDSSHMTIDLMIKLAKRINALLASGS
ncbi:MAG: asparaginase domain-containing protein, partial [Syntrophorhabdus sp.]